MSVIVFRPSGTRYYDSSGNYLDQVRRTAEDTYDVYVELNGASATREDLFNMMRTIDQTAPSTPRVAILYCETRAGLPVDENGKSLVCQKIKSVVRGWGLFFVGGRMRSGLSEEVAEAGADFVLSFEKGLACLADYEDDVFEVITSGMGSLLESSPNPRAAARSMRKGFLQKIGEYPLNRQGEDLRALILLHDSEAVACFLPAGFGSPAFQPRSSHRNWEMIRPTGLRSGSKLSVEKRRTVLDHWLTRLLVILEVGILVASYAVCVFIDPDLGIRLLVTFQGAIAGTLGVGIVLYLLGQSRGGGPRKPKRLV